MKPKACNDCALFQTLFIIGMPHDDGLCMHDDYSSTQGNKILIDWIRETPKECPLDGE